MLVGLGLAFGRTAVGQYDVRRTAVVNDANTIGTVYLERRRRRKRSAASLVLLYAGHTDAESASELAARER